MDDHIFGAAKPRYVPPVANVPWHKSEARRLLEGDLATGRIPSDGREMGTSAVYASRPEYAVYTIKLFTTRLASMRKTARNENPRRAADVVAHVHDRQLHTQATHNSNGVPRWEGSDAERFLKQDITAGLNTQMMPRVLYRTRAAYHEFFTLDQFRGHIAQEVKSRKFKTSYFGR